MSAVARPADGCGGCKRALRSVKAQQSGRARTAVELHNAKEDEATCSAPPVSTKVAPPAPAEEHREKAEESTAAAPPETKRAPPWPWAEDAREKVLVVTVSELAHIAPPSPCKPRSKDECVCVC